MDEAASVTARIARLEAREEIRQLAARHAQAVDARDVQTLVQLFVEDVVVPDGRTGREALAEWYDAALRAYTLSFHLVGNHLVDLLDEARAHATLYCRAELQYGEQWVVMPLLYEDVYARRDGRWLFEHRSARAFYAVDVLDRPSDVPGRFARITHPDVDAAELPEAWPSWRLFWTEPGAART